MRRNKSRRKKNTCSVFEAQQWTSLFDNFSFVEALGCPLAWQRPRHLYYLWVLIETRLWHGAPGAMDVLSALKPLPVPRALSLEQPGNTSSKLPRASPASLTLNPKANSSKCSERYLLTSGWMYFTRSPSSWLLSQNNIQSFHWSSAGC